MFKKFLLKIISVVLVLSVANCPLIAGTEQQEYKLAAQSRFQKYFGSEKNKGLLDGTNMPVFINALTALNKVITDPTKTDENIRGAIAEQNANLAAIGVVVDGVYHKNIGLRSNVPYLLMAFKNQQRETQTRDLYFLGDSTVWNDQALAQIGVSSAEDKGHLKVPGLAGCWITGHQEITRGLAAGEEMAVSPESIIDLIISDLLKNILTVGMKKALMRGAENDDYKEAKKAIEKRLKEIVAAVQNEVSFLVGLHLYNSVRTEVNQATRWGRNNVDHFTPPESKPIYAAQEFRRLLDTLINNYFSSSDNNESSFRMRNEWEKSTRSRPYWRGQVLKGIGLDMNPDKLTDKLIRGMTNSFLTDPDVLVDDLEQKRNNMLTRIKSLAGSSFGFTNIECVGSSPDNFGKLMAVIFNRTYLPAVFRWQWRLQTGRLVVYEHTLARLVVLEETLGEEVVSKIINSVLTIENARTKFAESFLNDLSVTHMNPDEAFARAALMSYAALILPEEEFVKGNLNAVEGWNEVWGLFFWVSHIYNNPNVDPSKEIEENNTAFYELIKTEIGFMTRFKRGKNWEELLDETGVEALAKKLAPSVWAIHNNFINKLREKTAISTEGEELAAGEETRPIPLVNPADALEEKLQKNDIPNAEQVVIDFTWGLLAYKTNPQTGLLEEMPNCRVALDALPISVFDKDFIKISRLQLVFSNKIHTTWAQSVSKAVDLLRSGGEVKFTSPDRLTVDFTHVGFYLGKGQEDRKILLFTPNVKDAQNAFDNKSNEARAVVNQGRAVLSLEKLISAITNKQKGFIEIDARLFQTGNKKFNNELRNRLLQIYRENLCLVRLVGEGGAPEEMREVIDRFNKKAQSEEWQGVERTRDNTVTLAAESTNIERLNHPVIRLGLYGKNREELPQVVPALNIARAIIYAGSEGQVQGELLTSIKNLCLSLLPADAPEELRNEIKNARFLNDILVGIVLPPISPEDFRIYEYLLLGSRAADIAA